MCGNARYNGKNSFDEWEKDWALEDRYNFRVIENKWQKIWNDTETYKIDFDWFGVSAKFLCQSDVILQTGYSRFYTAYEVMMYKNRMVGLGGIYPVEENVSKLLSGYLTKNNKNGLKFCSNIANLDEIIDTYGVDAFRLYEMFIGPFNQPVMWSEDCLSGMHRFINKVFTLFDKVESVSLTIKDTQIMHKCIIEVSERIDQMKFNTAVSSLMIFANYLSGLRSVPKEMYAILLKLMAPFTPHLAEEMWARLGNTSLIIEGGWPKGNTELAQDNTATIAVQVNGKVRGTIEVERGAKKEMIVATAKTLGNVAKQLAVAKPNKIIVVPNRIVNIVV